MTSKCQSSRSALAMRFWAKVKRGKSKNCWSWSAFRDEGGYGKFRVGDKCELAHRVAWMLTNGALSNKSCVLHHCDTPCCCNPAHLYVGTPLDNARDRSERKRTARGKRHGFWLHPESVPRGERSGKAVLTVAGIQEIRRRYTRGERISSIARMFHRPFSTISEVLHGRTWRHVK